MRLRPALSPTLSLLLLALAVGCDGGDTTGDDGRGLGDGGAVRPDAAPGAPLDGGPSPSFDAGGNDGRLNSIIPSRGEIAGGLRVRLVGRDFVAGVSVFLGDARCRDIEVENENHLRCTTPPADQVGPVHVKVTWPDGARPAYLEEGFTYYREVALRTVEPDRAPAAGGVEVQIDGAGFVEPTEVRFGGVAATEVEVLNALRLRVVAPRSAPGTVDVVVRNINGEARLPGAFTYFEALLIEAVTPDFGSEAGGEEAVIDGAGLTEGSRVTIGGAAAEVGASELGRQRLRITTPAGAPGPADVVVENVNGTFTARSAYLYLADADGPFGITGVVPDRVASVGGATFLVGGNGFDGTVEVKLDDVVVPCDVERAQMLRCTAPAADPGSVDVVVTKGDETARLADGLTYFEAIDVFDVRPPRGAVAGGTVVELVGRGFTEDMELSFDGQALELVELVDGERAFARTPPGRPGFVALRASTPFDDTLLPEAFEYFDPVSRFGGVWGDPIGRAINVTVLDAYTGEAIEGARVLAVALDADGRWEGTCDAKGQVTLSERALAGPVSVTAAQAGYEVGTFERVTHENVTLYLTPHQIEQGGGNRDPIPPSRLMGRVVGLGDLEKPLEPGLVLAAFVETSHSSLFNRTGLPWPEPNGVLLEDGAFEVFVRPGELAAIVTAGYVRKELLDGYLDGSLDYGPVRADLQPIAMGVQRFISVSPGEAVEDIEVRIDKTLDLEVPVTLQNVSAAVTTHEVRVFLDFGPEGYWELDSAVDGPSPQMQMLYMPDMTQWDADIDVQWFSLSRSETDDWTPYSATFLYERDFAAGMVVAPNVGTVTMLNPVDNGELGPGRVVEWVVDPALDGPAEPPHANLVTIESARGLPLWSHVTPGAVTHYQLPALPADILPGGLVDDLMYLTVTPIIVEGPFDYADFSYSDIGFGNRRSYSVTTVPFYP